MTEEKKADEAQEEVVESAPDSEEAKESKDESGEKESSTTVTTEKTDSSQGKRTDRQRRDGGRGDVRGRGHDQGGRSTRFKRKVCRFCHDKDLAIDYKKPELLERFITDRGKILPRRVTGTCARHQRALSRAIKRARIIAYLPFVEQ